MQRDLVMSNASILRVLASLSKFISSYKESLKIFKMFKHFGTVRDFEESCGMSWNVMTSYAEPCRVVASYPELQEEVFASY